MYLYASSVSTKLKMPHTRVPTPTKYGVKSNKIQTIVLFPKNRGQIQIEINCSKR